MTESPTAGVTGPHGDRPVVSAGAPRGAARAVLVALHGRGATARGVVNLFEPAVPRHVAVVAPHAERSRWYPGDTAAPLERNEPHVSSALAVLDALVADAVSGYDVPRERVALAGFSQGACVAAAYLARRGGPTPIVGLAGTLLGSTLDHANYEGRLQGTPVRLSVGAEDDRVPAERVRATAATFRALGGDVQCTSVEGAGHEVTDAGFSDLRTVLKSLVDGSTE